MRFPWQRKKYAPPPAWLVRAHANALILVCAAELMRKQPELIPILRNDLLAWARQAVEALKPAAIIVSDTKILRFAARKQ